MKIEHQIRDYQENEERVENRLIRLQLIIQIVSKRDRVCKIIGERVLF